MVESRGGIQRWILTRFLDWLHESGYRIVSIGYPQTQLTREQAREQFMASGWLRRE